MKRLGVLISFGLAIGLVTGLGCAGDGNVVDRFWMDGIEMEPTIPDGTVLDVLDYGDASPERVDVVVFPSPYFPDLARLERLFCNGRLFLW